MTPIGPKRGFAIGAIDAPRFKPQLNVNDRDARMHGGKLKAAVKSATTGR